MVAVHSSTSARAGAGRRAELPAHALGAQLDRRQRILDLVRQPPRHVAPRRHALRPDERRHVVEDQDRAAGTAIVAQQRRRRRREVELAPVAQRARSPAPPAAPPPPRRRARWHEQRRERLQILAPAQVLGPRADDRAVDFEEAQRRAVDRFDLPVGPERDDASRDALEHRLDVLPALVELLVLALEIEARVFELALARRQLSGHRIERLDERAELVARLRLDAVIEVAGADLARAGGQQLHRTRDALGQIRGRSRSR